MFVFVGGVSIISERQLPPTLFHPLPPAHSHSLASKSNQEQILRVDAKPSFQQLFTVTKRQKRKEKRAKGPSLALAFVLAKLHIKRRGPGGIPRGGSERVASGHGRGRAASVSRRSNQNCPLCHLSICLLDARVEATPQRRPSICSGRMRLIQCSHLKTKRKETTVSHASSAQTPGLSLSPASIIPPTSSVSVSLSVFLKDDSETATLVRGMRGLFEPVFPLTTNKYPCQSVGVYLACLSAISHVFFVCIVDICLHPNLLRCTAIRVFILPGLAVQTMSARFSILSCCESINIFRKLLLMDSDKPQFLDHTVTALQSLRPHLKGRFTFNQRNKFVFSCVCVFQKSQWSTPQLW